MNKDEILQAVSRCIDSRGSSLESSKARNLLRRIGINVISSRLRRAVAEDPAPAPAPAPAPEPASFFAASASAD